MTIFQANYDEDKGTLIKISFKINDQFKDLENQFDSKSDFYKSLFSST